MRHVLLSGVAATVLAGCASHDAPKAAAQPPPKPVKYQTITTRNQDGSTRSFRQPALDRDDAPDIKVDSGDDGRYKITFSSPKPPPKGAPETDRAAR